jgi:hypothetical protein
VVFAAAVPAVASDRVPEAVAKKRDLRSYEYGGAYRTPVNVRELTDIQRLRQFVLTHWTQKRRGYVEFVFQGTDAGSEHYVFIEPVGDHWRIAWVDQYCFILPGYSPPPPQFHRDVVTVERCRGSLIFFDAKDRVVTYL